MTLRERAQSLKTDEIVVLLREREQSQQRSEELATRNAQLTTSCNELKRQLDWFKRQLFGARSERRAFASPDTQLMLGQQHPEAAAAFASSIESSPTVKVPSHERRKRNRGEGWVTGQGLRFDEDVPREVHEIPNPALDGLSESDYEVIAVRSSYRLAQRPSHFVILEFRRKVVRIKESGEITCPAAPAAIFDRSLADVSFLAGLCVEKFTYHMPLYRQHQRLKHSGIEVDRSTLTHLMHRTADLLRPVVEAQRRSILQSKVLALDETPIRAGRKPGKGDKPGKMKQGYYWPLYGDQDEVLFHFEPNRKAAAVPKLLEGWTGTLVTDGYKVYEGFAKALAEVTHAQCWVHARRNFEQAEKVEPELCKTVLGQIAALYQNEKTIRKQGLTGNDKRRYRRRHSKPIVEALFERLKEALNDPDQLLLPSNDFTAAARYAETREDALKVFLDDPDVPLDTNHLEREIRPIAIGRKNWMFCWTEAGAEVVATVQSLLQTCRLQGVDPYTYLVDVLQRIQTHPASDVEQLIPRLWKENFADHPMRSMVDASA